MRTLRLLLVPALFLATACVKQVPPKIVEAVRPPPAPAPVAPATQEEAKVSPSVVDPVVELESLLASSRIHFGLDDAILADDARDVLQRVADALRRSPSSVVIEISGHCDERGTTEYNLALGHRRAMAAKSYLVALGVAENRVQLISYGDQRPAAVGHDELAWRANGRDEFRVAGR